MTWALDASAVLAWLRNEPGGAELGPRLASGVLGAANAAEVVSKLVVRGMNPAQAQSTVQLLPCEIAEISVPVGLAAGVLHAATRSVGLSLADCLCLALAQTRALTALTADRAWGALPIDVAVEVIR